MTTTETKTSTTPGPWECPGTDGGEWVICANDKCGKKRTLAHVYSLADSRLIRAAPELLAALDEMLACHELRAHKGETFTPLQIKAADVARAALQLARGTK